MDKKEDKLDSISELILNILYVLHKQGIDNVSKGNLFEIINAVTKSDLPISEKDYSDTYTLTEVGLKTYEDHKKAHLH